MGPLKLNVEIERWPYVRPFRITGYTWECIEVLVVTLVKDGLVGRGEAAGVYYLNDTPPSMMKQVVAARAQIEAGIDRVSLRAVFDAGGASGS